MHMCPWWSELYLQDWSNLMSLSALAWSWCVTFDIRWHRSQRAARSSMLSHLDVTPKEQPKQAVRGTRAVLQCLPWWLPIASISLFLHQLLLYLPLSHVLSKSLNWCMPKFVRQLVLPHTGSFRRLRAYRRGESHGKGGWRPSQAPYFWWGMMRMMLTNQFLIIYAAHRRNKTCQTPPVVFLKIL